MGLAWESLSTAKLVLFLASRNSTAQYPASAHLCSLTQTRTASEALERKCSMAIFSRTSDFNEQSSNHRFARSTRLVASSVYDFPFPRDHSRNLRRWVSSLMSYHFIIACGVVASFVGGEGHIGPPRQLWGEDERPICLGSHLAFKSQQIPFDVIQIYEFGEFHQVPPQTSSSSIARLV